MAFKVVNLKGGMNQQNSDEDNGFDDLVHIEIRD